VDDARSRISKNQKTKIEVELEEIESTNLNFEIHGIYLGSTNSRRKAVRGFERVLVLTEGSGAVL
jgi:hypothetical protein